MFVFCYIFHKGYAQMYGDGHYTTFDGKTFTYQGHCPNILVETNEFIIMTNRKACSGKSCHMIVIINYRNSHTELTANKGDLSAIVNKVRVKTPYVAQSKNFTVTMSSSSFLKFESRDGGVKVLWDGKSRMYVKIAPTYKGRVSGLFGNFNGKTIDDFSTPSGDQSHSEIDFGNSWLVPNGNCSKMTNNFKLTHCESNHQITREAEKRCSVLMSDIFKPCHSVEDPLPYYQNCKEDVCGCKNGEQDCLCSVVSSYARQCGFNSKEIRGWRESRGCGMISVILFIEAYVREFLQTQNSPILFYKLLF